MRNSKGWLELGLIYHLNKGRINFQRGDKTKGKDFELLRSGNCGKANMWGS